MFKIKPENTFPFKVTLHVPGQGGVEVTLIGKHLNKRELEEAGSMTSVDFCRKVVTGWKDEDFDSGFSQDALEDLLEKNASADVRIVQSYYAEIFGNGESKGGHQAKN